MQKPPSSLLRHHLSIFIFLAALPLMFAACHSDKPMQAKLDRIDSLINNNRIDEAYRLMRNDSVKYAQASHSLCMRYMLAYTDVKNRLFIPLTDDSMMVEVEKFYASKGNPNEQTKARYLLAACYRDMNIDLEAQKWATTAIENADTTYQHFDYRILYNAYILLGNSFHSATSTETTLDAYEQATYYALLKFRI